MSCPTPRWKAYLGVWDIWTQISDYPGKGWACAVGVSLIANKHKKKVSRVSICMLETNPSNKIYHSELHFNFHMWHRNHGGLKAWSWVWSLHQVCVKQIIVCASERIMNLGISIVTNCCCLLAAFWSRAKRRVTQAHLRLWTHIRNHDCAHIIIQFINSVIWSSFLLSWGAVFVPGSRRSHRNQTLPPCRHPCQGSQAQIIIPLLLLLSRRLEWNCQRITRQGDAADAGILFDQTIFTWPNVALRWKVRVKVKVSLCIHSEIRTLTLILWWNFDSDSDSDWCYFFWLQNTTHQQSIRIWSTSRSRYDQSRAPEKSWSLVPAWEAGNLQRPVGNHCLLCRKARFSSQWCDIVTITIMHFNPISFFDFSISINLVCLSLSVS